MSSRTAYDSSLYAADNIDWAFQRAADEFNRIAGTSKTIGTLTLTANSINLPAPPSDWTPSQHLQQTLLCSGLQVNPNIHFVDYNQIESAMWLGGTSNQNTIANSTASSPIMFAYKDETTGYVWPAPSQDGYTIEYWYWRKFTSWTPGQACVSATVNTSGTITAVTVIQGGYYPGNSATITVTGGTGSGASLSAILQNNVLSTVTINSGGTGYTSPTILVNGSTAADITFNLADEALRIIISDGVQGYMQNIEPQNSGLAAEALARFERNAKAYGGRAAGGRAAQIWQADNPSPTHANQWWGNPSAYPYVPLI